MLQELRDPDLGIVYFDAREMHDMWTVERDVNFNGHNIPIRIEPDVSSTSAFSEVQRQAALIALNLPADTLLRSAPAVIQNYECYREYFDETELPKLTSPIEIWNLVEPNYIVVPVHSFPPHYDVKIPTFILYAECIWDIEHGLEVRFRNGYADESDQQGHLRVEIN